MINKSELRNTIKEKFEEHEVEDNDLAEDLLDALVRDFGEEIYDDEDEESESEEEGPDFL